MFLAGFLLVVVEGLFRLAETTNSPTLPAGVLAVFCLFAWLTTRIGIWGFLLAFSAGLFVATPPEFDHSKVALIWSVSIAVPAIGWLYGHLLLELMHLKKPAPAVRILTLQDRL